ncbi:hypothetical protein [Nocardia sp. NPDC059691]|uniref:helix-turn-helix domain-containing protein n=1 Tax=Nocardia sp. NPDC059691 TaxID=3346908 RepID=UPI00368F46AF
MTTVSPRSARLTFRALEPIPGMIYFTPHGPEAYRDLGLTDPGHVALLATEGLDGIEALITHSATGEVAAEVLRLSRSWSEQDWASGVDRLRARGWLANGALSEHGAARRGAIEDRTDELAVYPYEAIGEDGCARLRALASSLAVRVIEGDLGFPSVLSERYRQAIQGESR